MEELPAMAGELISKKNKQKTILLEFKVEVTISDLTTGVSWR